MTCARADLIATEAEVTIKRVRETDFTHEPIIDEETQTYKVDDGAFVALLLEHCAPEELRRVPKRADERYPDAKDFYEFFETDPHREWERVRRIADAKRGDILAWRDTDGGHGRSGGHVAVLAHEPEFDSNARTWTVRVHDSSSAPHFDDSRQRGHEHQPGIGSGAFKLRVGSNGAPVAVQVGPHSDFHRRPIAIGRLARGSIIAETRPESRAPDGAAPFGHRIERGAVANEILHDGEFAITTYALASSDGLLLPPTTLAYWGPGQKISQSVGNGVTTYSFVGGVVFRNC
jgi:hypothetical protein